MGEPGASERCVTDTLLLKEIAEPLQGLNACSIINAHSEKTRINGRKNEETTQKTALPLHISNEYHMPTYGIAVRLYSYET